MSRSLPGPPPSRETPAVSRPVSWGVHLVVLAVAFVLVAAALLVAGGAASGGVAVLSALGQSVLFAVLSTAAFAVARSRVSWLVAGYSVALAVCAGLALLLFGR